MTKAEVKERLFRWVAVPALAAVLALLAVLQYKWSGQVSTATRAQMQSNLQTSLLGFRQDVARELTSACLEIKAALDASPAINSADLKEQFHHWQQTAAHPNLVQHIYVWEDPVHQEQPLRFDPGRDQSERAAWPPEFGPLQQHLKQASVMIANARPPMRAHEQMGRRQRRSQGQPQFRHDGHMLDHGGPPMGFAFVAMDQSIPAVLFPVHRRGPLSQPGSSPMTWVVIHLNKSVLQKEDFPELAQKYFRGESGLDYHVAVRDSGNGQDRVIYASDPGFGADDNIQVDAALTLFGPPFGSAGGPSPS